MNIDQPAVKRAVRWFANWVSVSMPTISFEDAMQDLWMEVVKAAPKYDDTTMNAFTTFIGKHLRWRAINMIDNEATRLRYTAAYVSGEPDRYYQDDQSVEKLINQVRKHLNPFDQKVFNLMVDPLPGMISESEFSPDYVTSWRLASHLGVHRRHVDYAKTKIRKVIKRLSSVEVTNNA